MADKYWRCPLCKKSAGPLNQRKVLGQTVCLRCAENRKELIRDTMIGRKELIRCIDLIEEVEEIAQRHYDTYPFKATTIDSHFEIKKIINNFLPDGIVFRDAYPTDYNRMIEVTFGPANMTRYVSFEILLPNPPEIIEDA